MNRYLPIFRVLNQTKIAGLLNMILLLTLGGFNSCNVNPQTTTVDAKVSTLAISHSVIDASNNGNNCGPSSSPPAPRDYYQNLPHTAPLKSPGNGLAGTEVWRNQTCNSFRQDLYRSIVKYDVASLQNLKGLITKAIISFQTEILPQQAPLCDPSVGGGGVFSYLPANSTFPQTHFEIPTQFPRGRPIFNITGQLVREVTSSPTGLGGTRWEIDVTTHLTRAIDNGDASINFMLEGSNETLLDINTPPANGSDCRTVYSFQSLTITHL